MAEMLNRYSTIANVSNRVAKPVHRLILINVACSVCNDSRLSCLALSVSRFNLRCVRAHLFLPSGIPVFLCKHEAPFVASQLHGIMILFWKNSERCQRSVRGAHRSLERYWKRSPLFASVCTACIVCRALCTRSLRDRLDGQKKRIRRRLVTRHDRRTRVQRGHAMHPSSFHAFARCLYLAYYHNASLARVKERAISFSTPEDSSFWVQVHGN